MKFPKGHNKGTLLLAVDAINDVFGSPLLRLKSKTVPQIIEATSARLKDADPIKIAEIQDDAKETLIAFRILDPDWVKDKSEDLEKILGFVLDDRKSYHGAKKAVKCPSKKELKKMKKAAKKEPKKQEGTKGKRPGIIKAIIESLENAKKPGLTLKEIHAILVEKFPERDPEKMLNTIRTQLGGKKRPLYIEKNRKGLVVKVKGEGKNRTYRI